AAITETTLALSYEINTPFSIISGLLELLESDLQKNAGLDSIKDKFYRIRENFNRANAITNKLLNIKSPFVETVHGNVKMINIDKSEYK
ncbi:MAG: hypothetical protein JW994_01385, partial [Candidatus Omnitrophica bacterium]|nr:hypothetical protein [Candidatus Omnitrophota bacterium]